MGSWGFASRLVTAALAVTLLAACGTVARAPTGEPSPSPSTSPIEAPSASPSATPSPSRHPLPTPQPRRLIRISLSAQHLWVYQDGAIVVSTDVTTGMPALPTPTGTFRVMAKYSPYKFVSPWPRGSPYYYEPEWTNYALLFADGGYFIHDAGWQQNFGPGGNLKTGSHGCVNVPPAAMPAIYRWANVGDLVIVVA